MAEDKELTLNEVCKRLRLSKRTIFYRIRNGDLKARKMADGWQWFVTEAEVEAVKDLEWYRNSRLTAA